MSLRDRLFKPRWQHRDPQVRAAAVATAEDVELRRQLVQIARQDSDAQVRCAAIARLTQLENILPCALEDTDPKARQLALERLLPLILKHPECPPTVYPLIESWDSQDLLEQVAGQAHDVALRRLALGRCLRQGFLGQCASSDAVAANRALALSRISQESTLKQVAERLRRSDKQLYRQALERLDQDGKQPRAHDDHAERLCLQAEALVRGQGMTALSEQVPQLRQAWQQLEQPSSGHQRRFQGALDILEQALRGPREVVATATSVNQELTAAAIEAVTPVPETAVEDAAVATEREPHPSLLKLAAQLIHWEAALDEADAAEKAKRQARAERNAARKAARQHHAPNTTKRDTSKNVAAEGVTADDSAALNQVSSSLSSAANPGEANQPSATVGEQPAITASQSEAVQLEQAQLGVAAATATPGEVADSAEKASSGTAASTATAATNASTEPAKARQRTIRPPRLNQLQRWRDDWRQAWPGATPSAAEQALEHGTLAHWQRLNERLEALQAQQQRAQQSLDQGLQALRHALDQKQLVNAAQAARQCQKIQRQHRLRIPMGWRELMAELDHQRELLQWALGEKRQELVSQASMLQESELHPDATLERLRELRHAWQQLDDQERQISMRSQQQAHWNTFNSACNAAMTRIKPFLEKRQQLRSERGELLQTLAQQAHEQLNAETSDTKALLDLRRQLIDALRELAGVPRQQRQAIAQQLRDALNRVDTHLDQLEKSATARKRKLIQSAVELSQNEIPQDAVNQVRQLQEEWRQAGHIRRGQEQKLWKEFRAPIDALFARLDAAREERTAAYQAQEQVWEEQAQALEKLAEEAPQLHAAAVLQQAFQPLRQAWEDSQVRVPPLQQRWRQAAQRIQTRLQELHSQATQASREALWISAQSWQSWAQARCAGADVDAPEPNSPLQVKLLELSGNALQQALDAALPEAAELCIAMEYLAGLDSPVDAQQARMQYQVQRLAERLGQGIVQDKPRAELEALEQRWFALQPLAPSSAAAYIKRFRHAWEVAIQTL